MFEKYYDFRYRTKTRTFLPNETYDWCHFLCFKDDAKHRYIVRVEENTDICFYGIKFYLHSTRWSESSRYRIATGFGNASAVIITCVQIMLYFLQKNPYASFGFIGAQGFNEASGANTKRFRLYHRIMEYFFSPVRFNHYVIEEKSVYLILNKQEDSGRLLPKIEQIFQEYLTE